MPEQPPSGQGGGRDNSAILLALIETFSQEAQEAARKKASDLGYSFTRGDIPFDETLINLSNSRDILKSSITSGSLPQLPLRIQGEIISAAREVSTNLTALINGVDSILPMERAVDGLTASIWYSNLQNMTGEVLGLQEKLNQLKTLEATLRELAKRAEAFKASEKRAIDVLSKLEELESTAKQANLKAHESATDAENQLEVIQIANHEIGGYSTAAQQAEKDAAEAAAASRVSGAEIEAIHARAKSAIEELEDTRSDYEIFTKRIQDFKEVTEAALQIATEKQIESFQVLEKRSNDELKALQDAALEAEENLNASVTKATDDAITAARDGYKKIIRELQDSEESRESTYATHLQALSTGFDVETKKLTAIYHEKMNDAAVRSKSIVDKNERAVAERMVVLEELESQIREKIQLATNYQLFHAFQTRQMAIAEGKDFWRKALFTCVGISCVISISFLISLFFVHTFNAAFYLKLTVTIPLIYAIHFCSSQYSRERQLEEEYAFKGNISISLDPYRQLVEKLIDKDNPTEAAKYSEFVIASVGKVFTSPASAILGEGEKKVEKKEKQVEEASKGLDRAVKAITGLVDSLAKLK